MKTIKAHKLREMKKEELEEHLKQAKQELGNLRVQKIRALPAQLSQISVVRKQVARALTVRNAKRREGARKYFATKKYTATELRVKKTRAIRRRLSPEDKARKTARQLKKEAAFPQRKYAVRN
eukprot:g2965.t1